MDKDEAIKYVKEFSTDSANIFGYAIDESDVDEFINQIYSDFDKQCCDNCKYFTDDVDLEGQITNICDRPSGVMEWKEVPFNFYCNQYEKR